MKKRRISFYIMLCCFSTLLQAQSIATGHINTEIVLPLLITEYEQLSFGKFVSATNGGSIQVSVSSERTSTGEIQLIDENGSSGKFVISGVPGALVSVILPSTPCYLYQNGIYRMAVTDFLSNIPTGGKGIDLVSGKLEIHIGALLHVESTTLNPPGLYTGSYDITFGYN